MRDYILPIPELKKIEPILTEYFGYKRAMFENELSATYYHEYPNGISEDICKNYMTDYSFLNTIAVDNGVFDYKRYAPKPTSTSKAFNPSSFIMDSEHNILITLPSDNLLERLTDLLQKHGETDNDGVIGISMLVVAAIYEKYKNGELYTEVTISENTLPYLEQVRPEMLKLYELLNTKRYSPSKKKELRVFSPITIDNGVKKITLDNSCYWLSDLLDNYLHIYLGVNSLEEAQQELKEVYSQKKGRKANNAAHNLIMYGTFHLLQRYSVQRINVMLKEIKKKYRLHIGNFSCHSLRKTFGRQVYNMNNDNSELALVKLMELFNHSSVSITKRYLGLRQEELLNTYDCLSF